MYLEYILITTLFALPAIWASVRVKTVFRRYEKVGVRSGMTGAQAAAAVARAGGAEVTIERHQGFLSDHYDPRTKTLRLSPQVHDGRSISSIAVGAHEAGHAIQDVAGYAPLGLRSKLVPVTMIGSRLWGPMLILSYFANIPGLIELAIGAFALTVVFQLVTLPVEFNASSRAKAVLASTGIVQTQEEALGVEKVLGAAAMTYVAAALQAILTLVYLVIRSRD
jgi:Zn-dependent membrane protease YugP